VTPEAALLALLFLLAAVLYSSVGHAGASAYLAAMALVGTAPEVMRPTALTLNLLVASIVVVRFAGAGHLPWRQLVPLLVASVPTAFIGGLIQLPKELYAPLVAIVLLIGAWRLAATHVGREPLRARVPWVAGVLAGGGIGLLAGLTGTGGGIFLTPLLVLAGWAPTRQAAGLSGAFILANSIAGLAGIFTGGIILPGALPFWVAVVGVGGLIGSWLGAARFSIFGLRRVLAVVLVVAAIKLIVLP
jgi:uncharacterized membrane protein YfcA